jgi:hypothetical protein
MSSNLLYASRGRRQEGELLNLSKGGYSHVLDHICYARRYYSYDNYCYDRVHASRQPSVLLYAAAAGSDRISSASHELDRGHRRQRQSTDAHALEAISRSRQPIMTDRFLPGMQPPS